jgi:hypothetical protein
VADGIGLSDVRKHFTGLPACACRKSNPDILVVQSTQDRTAKMCPAGLSRVLRGRRHEQEAPLRGDIEPRLVPQGPQWQFRWAPTASRAPRSCAFDIIVEKALTVTRDGIAREITVEEGLQQRTCQDALDGKGMASVKF